MGMMTETKRLIPAPLMECKFSMLKDLGINYIGKGLKIHTIISSAKI